MKRYISLIILSAFLFINVNAQQAGLPFIRNFSPQEYKTSPQNWSIVQDQRGVMYFGNNDGVLVYDGSDWRLVKQPGVSALAVDSTGCIFIAFDNDIGFMQPDVNGSYQYYSLKSKIPEKHRDISACYSVFTLRDRVVFQTSDKLFVYDYDKIKVLTTEKGFYWSFSVNEDFYVTVRDKGLFYLKNDTIIMAPGGELFAKESIASMLPYKKNEILISTYRKGIFIYSTDGEPRLYKPEGFEEVDKFIFNNDACCGIKLSNSDFAIGTIQGGIISFTGKGKIINIYNKSTGLQDNSVYWLYSDNNQQLWAALDNGISLIQNNIPFTKYTEKQGLNGGTMCLTFFKDNFYVGTSQYLYIQNKSGDFEPIEGTESQNFHLYEAKGSLLIANLSGISEIKGNKAYPLEKTANLGSLSLCTLSEQPGYLLAGTTNGLYLLEFANQSWKLKHRIKGFTKEAYKLGVDKDGNIWASTFLDLYRLRLNFTLDSVISYQLCTPEQGLPSSYAMAFTLNSGQVVFCSEKGVYDYLNSENRFVPNADFTMLTGKVIQFVQDKKGDIWFEQLLENGNYEKGVLKLINGHYTKYTTPFEKFKDMGGGDSPYNICIAPDGSVIFGTGMGLLKYNPSIDVKYDKPFNTLIRSVYSNDSLLFAGEELIYPFSVKNDGKEMPYSHNNMSFHFSATFYEDAEKNLYSYRLIGLDSKWSEWTHDSKKDYTYLPGGRFIFQVKSKNEYGVTGSTASYSFSILPPWYRTGWAIVLYFAAFVLILIVIMKIYTRRLAKQKVLLEEVVDIRTAEVLDQKQKILENNEILTRINDQLNESNKELNQTNEKLRTTLDIVNTQKEEIEGAHLKITDQNKELKQYRSHLEQLVEERTKELLFAKNKAEESDRLKTAFLQNMSHEIRTPMNGILGFLELLREPDLDDVNKSNYINIINDSGQRLLTTINDIIELSRIESNQLAVHYSKVDVMKIMDYHFNFFRRQAQEKGLSLINSATVTGKQAIIESDKQILDNILTNLINNAIKFTHKGSVEFGNYLENGSMIFFVKDTGVGIPADRIDAIFDRFVQADIKNTRTHEGSGLGLAIVKGYLDLINGSIWVKSEAGKGSTFFFSIPYNTEAKEIVSEPERKKHDTVINSKLTVLVAEDDQNGFLYINSILKKVVSNILHVNNGRDAVRLLRENPNISIVLMDIKMPELNGLDATTEIRKFNSTVTIIAQSAYAFAEDREMAIDAGCNDYITKPIDSKELIQLINKYTQ